MSAPDASEQTIFEAACQMPDEPARTAYLDAACAARPDLRQRVEKLLEAGLRADEFLATDPLEWGQARPGSSDPALSTEGPGTTIDKVPTWSQTIQLWDLRQIRTELASLNLDWDVPAFPSLPVAAQPPPK